MSDDQVIEFPAFLVERACKELLAFGESNGSISKEVEFWAKEESEVLNIKHWVARDIIRRTHSGSSSIIQITKQLAKRA